MVDSRGAELAGRHLGDVLDADEYQAIQPHLQRALAGETVVFEREYRRMRSYRCFEATARPEWDVEHKTVTGVHVTTQEVTETRRRLSELAQLSQLDHLTQLLNRKGFDARLAQAVDAARQNRRTLALLYIDLDGFKPVNDIHGHGVGDALLCAFSRRLARLVRSDDAVARLGGDEFAVVLPAIADPRIAERLAAAIVKMAATPFDIDGARIAIGASVGVALPSLQAHEQAETVVRLADAMLYEAKRAGKGAFRVGATAATSLLPVP